MFGYSNTVRSLPFRVTLVANSQGFHCKRAGLYYNWDHLNHQTYHQSLLFGEFDALVLDVQRPVVVLDVVAPALEPLRLQLVAQRLLHQSRRRVTAAIISQLLEGMGKLSTQYCYRNRKCARVSVS